MIKNKPIKSIIGISAAVLVLSLMPVSAAAMNNVGGYGNNYYSSSPTNSICSVSINAYCETSNSFIENAPCKIMDSSGQYLKFNRFAGIYNISQSGDEILYTDSSGGFTVELPSGQYTLVTDNVRDFSVLSSSIPFYIPSDTISKNVDIEYARASGDVLLSLSDADGNQVSGCTVQVEDAYGNLVNFFSVGNNYSYVESSGKTTIPINDAVVSLSEFPAGSYALKVVESPAGSSPAMERYPFDINGSESVSINVQFAPEKTGQMSISNIDFAGTILTGSACSIVGSDNVILTFTKVSGSEYKYDPNGVVNTIAFETSDPLYIVGLPLGVEYTVNEVNTSVGYVLSDPQKVTLDSEEPASVLLTAKKTTGSLSITVSDDTTNDKVSDFAYTISSAATGTPMYFSLKDSALNSSSTYVYDEQGEITAVKTGPVGAITIEGIPAGEIIIRCKESPSGYVTDTTEITKTITPNITALCDLTVSKSNVAIEVVDENESPIIDVPVEIYNADGKIVLNGSTNAKGKILLTNVAAGSYTYRLAGVPEGYSFIDDIKSFTITPSGVAEGLSEIRLERTKIQVSIGQQEGNNTLENAVFVLYDAAGNEISRVLTSSSGIATFTGVGYGDYTIKQITAPIGYKVSDKELSITIDKTYTNEGVFDFSGDGEIASKEESSKENSAPDSAAVSEKKSLSMGDIYFIFIGVLVVCFVIVAAVSFFFKVKNGKKEEESDDGETENQSESISEEDLAPAAPIVFAASSQPETVDDEGVKIYTPPTAKVPQPEDISLSGKTPEELKRMEEQIRALIASHSDDEEGRKEGPSIERDN